MAHLQRQMEATLFNHNSISYYVAIFSLGVRSNHSQGWTMSVKTPMTHQVGTSHPFSQGIATPFLSLRLIPYFRPGVQLSASP